MEYFTYTVHVVYYTYIVHVVYYTYILCYSCLVPLFFSPPHAASLVIGSLIFCACLRYSDGDADYRKSCPGYWKSLTRAPAPLPGSTPPPLTYSYYSKDHGYVHWCSLCIISTVTLIFRNYILARMNR